MGLIPNVRQIAVALCALLLCAGCRKHEGEAIVLAKEYIPAAASPAPIETSPAPEATPDDEARRELGENEIVVDGYVMTPEMRGTSRDPRALTSEQWRVTVRTVTDGRTIVVQAAQKQFDQLKEAERIRVRYRTGKYTDTVWSAEIVP